MPVSRINPLAQLTLLLLLLPASLMAQTLEQVLERGVLRCGVNGEVPGLSFQDEDGDWSGLDVDLCRAVASAALGAPDKVEFIALKPAERLEALKDGKIDLLSRNTTWTQARDLGQGVAFTAILYYDGQSFMVPRASEKRSTLELSGANICAIAETTSIENAVRYFKQHQMPMTLTQYPDLDSAFKAYLKGDCSTLTTDRSQLHALRTELKDQQAQRILPEVISKEPLAPAVKADDQALFSLVRWTVYTLINAEEMGISSQNVAAAKARAQTPAVRTLLDLDGESGEALGIEPGWGYRVLSAVGNYAEVFDRNLGKQTALKMKRGMNALWTQGGLLYAPPPR